MAAEELKQKYTNEVLPALTKQFGYTSPMAAPKLVKIIVNMGLGEAVADAKVLDRAVEELGTITGQKPVITKARKSIATFKLRAGMPIGCRVTLRRDHMFEFFERLVNVALPRVRDFKGVSPKAFDGRGNYSLGLREQIIFPEIDYDKVDKLRGLSVAIVTTAKTDEEGFQLLKELGMPFSNS
jgi:large subunit ribosomal protein L5